MNILFLNDLPFNPHLGGIERVTDILTKELTGLDSNYNISYLSYKVVDKEILNYDFPASLYELPAEGDFSIRENQDFFLKLIEEQKIDIVVNQRGTFTTLTDALSKVKSAKVISVVHSTPDAYAQVSYYHNLRFSGHTLSGRIKRFFRRLFPAIYKKLLYRKLVPQLQNHYQNLLKVSDALVLLSPKYQENIALFINNDDIKDKTITSIPNPNTFHTTPVDFSNKKQNILFVGRLDPLEKAPMRLLKIWRKIHTRHKEWSLTIVGDGWERKGISSYIKRHHIPRVHLEGSRPNVADYYHEASILCLTSNFEGWPMVLPEAMIHGCIPICFNSFGAASDIIDEGHSGFLIEPFNLTQYSQYLSMIMNDKEKREEMGMAAQLKVKEFDSSNIVRKWDKLFRSI